MENSSSSVCSTCKQPNPDNTTNDITSENEILNDDHERIVELIKSKVLKATLRAIQPLLDKLEEATQQQTQKQAQQTPQDQLMHLQNAALEKMKMQEVKIAEKMKNLQSKVSKRV